jgi:hypothetical protein
MSTPSPSAAQQNAIPTVDSDATALDVALHAAGYSDLPFTYSATK